jgi:APA family basic amino acid/polyamine antiporter
VPGDGASLIALRRCVPSAERRFRCPASYVVGAFTIFGCVYWIASLPASALLWCAFWNAAGLTVYFAHSRSNNRLRIRTPGNPPISPSLALTGSPLCVV